MPREDKDFLTEDGQFGCPVCKGTKKVKYNINTPDRDCPGCEGTGYLYMYYKNEVSLEKSWHDQTRGFLDMRMEWIKKTSTCKTCKGNPGNTLGGCPCPECTLEGTMPWGG